MDGIISPRPELYTTHTYIVKKVYQDILFEAKDLNKGLLP
jgi:beta-galactosidase